MTLIQPALLQTAGTLLQECRARGLKLGAVESCTGGLIAAVLTAIPGSSDVFERGFVTYSNEAKAELVGVPPALIAEHGAVSEPVARRMAEGGVVHSPADLVVSVTGVAGPGGGSAAKPVGLVWIGLARRDGPTLAERHIFPGDRTAIRAATVERAFALIRAAL
jgi:nicotinamide-nucleotide amidase